jgi:undecaprenyl-diphosphatase
MTEFLETLDITGFRFINTSLSNSVFDVIMPFLTDLNKQKVVLTLVGAILLWMLIRGNRNTRLTALLLIVTIIFSDQLSSSIVKYLFERPRPCHTLHGVHLLVGCGSGFSFPSSHAVNNFAAALIITFFFPRSFWWWFGYASLVAFSRVYVGVHYPFDVFGGAVIGLFCASIVLAVFILWERYIGHFFMRKKRSA